jgi:hypothetical protein
MKLFPRYFTSKVSLFLFMSLGAVAGQNSASSGHAVTDEITLQSIRYASDATARIRDLMLDPTAFTVLQVIAITKQEKDGRTSFRGCVHYVGSNSYGGRRQQWGAYSVNKKGKLNSWLGGEGTHCNINKNDVQTDVTGEVQKSF